VTKRKAAIVAPKGLSLYAKQQLQALNNVHVAFLHVESGKELAGHTIHLL
jgi:hypothetical protein